MKSIDMLHLAWKADYFRSPCTSHIHNDITLVQLLPEESILCTRTIQLLSNLENVSFVIQNINLKMTFVNIHVITVVPSFQMIKY